jgi:hypothetical protein
VQRLVELELVALTPIDAEGPAAVPEILAAAQLSLTAGYGVNEHFARLARIFRAP